MTANTYSYGVWVSTADGMPEHGQEVLIFHVLGDAGRSPTGIDVAWWFGLEKGWTFPWDRDHLPLQKPRWVTHWMPLPDAPRTATRSSGS